MIQEILKDIDQKKDEKITQLKEKRDERILVLKTKIKKKIAERMEAEAEALNKENLIQLMEFSQKKDTEINFLLQDEKNRIIQNVWKGVEKEINAMSDEKFSAVIISLLKFIPEMKGTISASKRVYPILEKNLKNSNFKLTADLEVEGFFVKSDDLELNFKISEILEQMKEEHNPEIINILFSI